VLVVLYDCCTGELPSAAPRSSALVGASRADTVLTVVGQAVSSRPRWIGTRRSSSSNTATSSRRAPSASRYWRSVDTRTSSEYLHVVVDCCTREIPAWTLDLRARAPEAIGCVEAGLLDRNVQPGLLTIGTDNGSQFTSRDFRRHLSARGATHRRGGYRYPESQAFIESWFGQFKKRCAWRAEWESLDQPRREITAYIDT
jgi:transposase InsO family protein